MSRRGAALAAVLVLHLIVAPGGAAGSPAELSRAEKRLGRALEQVVDKRGGPPGAAALLRHGTAQTFIRAGVANVETGRLFREDLYMRLASTSKAYSGAVALALVDRGTMSLDDTVGARLPAMPPAWAPVTLRQLLGHTSGIPNITEDPGYIGALTADLRGEPAPAQLIGYMTETALLFPPGSAYNYSNTENMVVGLMAEAAAGVSYEQLLTDLVFEPLDLSATVLPRGFDLPRPRINGYERGPLENVTECCAMAWLWAAGGLYSTPLDLTGFTSAYVSGELFGGEARRAQFSFIDGESQPPGPGRIGAGLALFRYRTPCGTVFGHTGNVFGYTQFTAATRSGRRSLTVSVNEQLSRDVRPENFAPLKRAYRLAVCALLD
jgi:D-alanyl-D-alanine carboxypeptidase